MGFNWTEEKVALLTELAPKSKSVREIAVIFGLTRNAIIGKAHRIGIQLPVGRSGPPRSANYVPRTRNRGTGLSFRSKFAKPPRIIAVGEQPSSLNIAFDDLRRDHCRFPATDDAPYFFCGNPKAIGSSYCPHHHVVCHGR